MSLDEQKFIKNFNEESSSLNNYSTFLRSEAEFKLRKNQRKFSILAFVLSFYLLFILFFMNNYRKDRLLSIFIKDDTITQEINEINSKINFLTKDIDNKFNNVSTSASNQLNLRIDALEKSINLDSEKALTAGLIREQQKNLSINFSELKESQIRLENKMDNFVTTVLIGPIILTLLGFFVWFVQNKISKS